MDLQVDKISCSILHAYHFRQIEPLVERKLDSEGLRVVVYMSWRTRRKRNFTMKSTMSKTTAVRESCAVQLSRPGKSQSYVLRKPVALCQYHVSGSFLWGIPFPLSNPFVLCVMIFKSVVELPPTLNSCDDLWKNNHNYDNPGVKGVRISRILTGLPSHTFLSSRFTSKFLVNQPKRRTEVHNTLAVQIFSCIAHMSTSKR